jgi:hypothetical protein
VKFKDEEEEYEKTLHILKASFISTNPQYVIAV